MSSEIDEWIKSELLSNGWTNDQIVPIFNTKNKQQNQGNKKKLIIFVIAIVTLIAASYVFAQKYLTKVLTIKVQDALTSEPVSGISITVFPECGGPLVLGDGRLTCGGRYEPIPSGKTNDEGIFLINLTSDTPPHSSIHFQLGPSSAYTTDTGTHSFINTDGIVDERIVSIMPSNNKDDANVYDLDSAVAAAEKDLRVQNWKVGMEKTYPDGDVRAAFWRVYYQGVKGNRGDFHINMYVDPTTGKVVLYRQLGSLLSDKPERALNPWPDEPYAEGKVLLGFRDNYPYKKAQEDVSILDINLDGTNYYWQKSGIKSSDNSSIQHSDVFAVDVPIGKELEMANKLLNEVISVQSASVCPTDFCK